MSDTEKAIDRIKDAQTQVNHIIGMLGVLRAAQLTSHDGTVCDETTVDECVSGGEETLFLALKNLDHARSHLGDEKAKAILAHSG